MQILGLDVEQVEQPGSHTAGELPVLVLTKVYPYVLYKVVHWVDDVHTLQ